MQVLATVLLADSDNEPGGAALTKARVLDFRDALRFGVPACVSPAWGRVP
jgi:hypothetical protein